MNVNDSSDVYENFPQQGAARDESPSVHTADAPDSKLRAKESFDDLGSFGMGFKFVHCTRFCWIGLFGVS